MRHGRHRVQARSRAEVAEVGQVERQSHGLEVELLFHFAALLLARKRADRGEHLGEGGRLERHVVARGADVVGQHVAALEEDLERVVVDRDGARADAVEHGLERVGERDESVEAEGPGAALDRMHRAEDDVDRLGVGLAVVERLQAVLHRLKKLLALDEERGADFCHRV